jgi:hypothetical protein
MELKLLTVAARRADAGPATRGVSDTALRSEIQHLEARLATRLAAHEKTVAETQQTTGQAVQALREQLSGFGAKLAAVEERPVQSAVNVDALTQQIQAHVQDAVGAVTQQLTAHVNKTIEAANQQQIALVREAIAAATEQHAANVEGAIAAAAKQQAVQVNSTVSTVNQRMAAAEQNMEEIRKHFATLQANVAGDLHDFEKSLKAQGVAIESARTGRSGGARGGSARTAAIEYARSTRDRRCKLRRPFHKCANVRTPDVVEFAVSHRREWFSPFSPPDRNCGATSGVLNVLLPGRSLAGCPPGRAPMRSHGEPLRFPAPRSAPRTSLQLLGARGNRSEVAAHAAELGKLRVSHVTLAVNAI